MLELTGNLTGLAFDYKTGKAKLEIAVNETQDAAAGVDELQDSLLSIKISKYRKKRSLDANAYFWVLCGKLAEKTRQPKTEIYRQLIKEIGNNFEILPVRNDAVQTFIKNWQNGRLGWVCDILGSSKLEGYTNICCYYGSSVYDTEQMAALIDLIVFECKEQGIQTETPAEIERMLNMWGDIIGA